MVEPAHARRVGRKRTQGTQRLMNALREATRSVGVPAHLPMKRERTVPQALSFRPSLAHDWKVVAPYPRQRRMHPAVSPPSPKATPESRRSPRLDHHQPPEMLPCVLAPHSLSMRGGSHTSSFQPSGSPNHLTALSARSPAAWVSSRCCQPVSRWCQPTTLPPLWKSLQPITALPFKSHSNSPISPLPNASASEEHGLSH